MLSLFDAHVLVTDADEARDDDQVQELEAEMLGRLKATAAEWIAERGLPFEAIVSG